MVRARDLSNRVIATDDVREYAIEEAEKLNAKLNEEGFPTLVRPMLPSHVTGGFWLVRFSNIHLVCLIFCQEFKFFSVFILVKNLISFV